MSALLSVVSAASSSPLDYVTPWHDLTKTFSSGASAVNHAAWIIALVLKGLWLVFLIPCLIAFINALRRPEYLYPASTGYSKTLWVIALAAGFVFVIGWLVVPLYLLLVVLPARHQLDTAEGIGPTPSAEPPARPFKDESS